MDRFSLESNLPNAAGDSAVARHASRDSLFLTAQLGIGCLPAERVRVRNLSTGGLMAEYPSAATPGAPVTVALRGIGRIAGRVAWATDGRIGIAFDAPIDPIQARQPAAVRPVTPVGTCGPRRR